MQHDRGPGFDVWCACVGWCVLWAWFGSRMRTQGNPMNATELASFGRVFEECYPKAVAYARGYCGRVTDAEDVAAEAFAQILDLAQRGKGPGMPWPYLRTCIRNEAARRTAADKRTVSIDGYDHADQIADDVLPDRYNPTAAATAWASLEDRHRWILQLVIGEGLTPRDIAANTSMTPNTISALIYRARNNLRNAYTEQEHA